MTKQTKTILTGWILMIPLAVTIIVVLLQNIGVLEAHAVPVEQFAEEPAETSEIDLFDDHSAMPCVDKESFRRWYESYSTSAETVGSAEEDPQPVIYRIAGEEVDPEIQKSLYHHLEAEGIEYWYEGALAQMYQESRGDPKIVNSSNGIDTGLFQYREPFWDYSRGDIFDPEAQIELYVEETAARINAGLTVDEVISRHFTSDYVTEVDWEYVQQVRQWLDRMEAVR